MSLAEQLHRKAEEQRAREMARKQKENDKYIEWLAKKVIRWIRKNDRLLFRNEPHTYEHLNWYHTTHTFLITFTDGSQVEIALDDSEDRIYLLDRETRDAQDPHPRYRNTSSSR